MKSKVLRNMTCFAAGLLLVLLSQPVHAERTYTLDADFDEGTLVNVNHDAPNNGQLQLDVTTSPELPSMQTARSGSRITPPTT